MPSSTWECTQNKLDDVPFSPDPGEKQVSKPFRDQHLSSLPGDLRGFACQMQQWDCFISPDALLLSLWHCGHVLQPWSSLEEHAKSASGTVAFLLLKVYSYITVIACLEGKKQKTESQYHYLRIPFPSSGHTELRSDYSDLLPIPKSQLSLYFHSANLGGFFPL